MCKCWWLWRGRDTGDQHPGVVLRAEPEKGPAGGPESAEAGEQNGKSVGIGQANAAAANPESGRPGRRIWCLSPLDTHPLPSAGG